MNRLRFCRKTEEVPGGASCYGRGQGVECNGKDLFSHGCAATASPEGEASLAYISSPVKLNPAFTMSSGSLVNMELMD